MHVCMYTYARVYEVNDVVRALYCQVKFMCALSQNSLQLAKSCNCFVRLIMNI